MFLYKRGHIIKDLMEKKILEAALFMANGPLNLDELAKITGVHSVGFVKDLLQQLEKEYKDRGIEISQTPRGWEMQIKRELLPKVAHLTPYSDISEGAKRALALIVAKEPIKQHNLIKIQGNKAYAYVKELEGMGLVKTEKHGRSKIITVTYEFERYFGEDKKNIKERLQKELKIPKEKISDFVDKEDDSELKMVPEKQVDNGLHETDGDSERAKEGIIEKELKAIEREREEKKRLAELKRKKDLAASGEIDW